MQSKFSRTYLFHGTQTAFIIFGRCLDRKIYIWDIRETKKRPSMSIDENMTWASKVTWEKVDGNLLATAHDAQVSGITNLLELKFLSNLKLLGAFEIITTAVRSSSILIHSLSLIFTTYLQIIAQNMGPATFERASCLLRQQ